MNFPQSLRSLLPRDVWQALLTSGAVRSYRAGEVLTRQGDPGSHVFILAAGRVKIARVDSEGNELLLAVRGVGDIVGELAVLGGGLRSATVTALVPCVTYVLYAASFLRIIREKRVEEILFRWFREIYVETPEFSGARAALQQDSAVVLIGPPGCGRRTSGVVLLAGFDITPKTIVLDPEDLDRPLDVAPRHGYLLDLDEDRERLSPRTGAWLRSLAMQVRSAGSYLVVRARDRSWRALELGEGMLKTIRLTAPAAVEVFRSHLANQAPGFIADAWVERTAIASLLDNSSPADGVRLAQIVCKSGARSIPDDQQFEDVRAAYFNWAEELRGWFLKTSSGSENGYSRALLLAAAALEEAPAATVFAAADQLAKLVDLPRAPGGALVGPDAKTLVEKIIAELHEGSIRFSRPAYADSVLDHVWHERPQLHAAIREWLTNVPDARDAESGRAVQSLTDLAIRQREPSLVCSAAAQWARGSAHLRELAVGSLTSAAMSERIGRDVRRQMYQWARAEGTPEEIQLAVAAVCRSPLALAYPQIALTRLRHLAVRQNPNVQDAALESLASLATDSMLSHIVLTEVAGWSALQERRRSARLRAFLRLVERDETGEIVILSRTNDSDWDLLAELWHDALRDEDSEGAIAAEAAAAGWLDAVEQDRAEREVALAILARACRSSKDVVVLTKLAFGWAGADGASASRRDIAGSLLERALQRDPIAASDAQSSGGVS